MYTGACYFLAQAGVGLVAPHDDVLLDRKKVKRTQRTKLYPFRFIAISQTWASLRMEGTFTGFFSPCTDCPALRKSFGSGGFGPFGFGGLFLIDNQHSLIYCFSTQ